MDALQIEGDLQIVSTGSRCDSKLLAMAFINFTINTGFSYILPFFPVLAYQDANLDYTTIGILMSINSVGSTISAYIFGTRIQLWGRKRFYLIAIFGQSLVMILYASLYFITDNYYLFLCLSVFTRLFEGVFRSIYNVATFTYLNVLWKTGFAKRFSTMETASSSGQVFGFVIGSLVNYIFGYWMPLLGLALLFQLCLLTAYLFVPNDDTLQNTSTNVKAVLPINLALKNKETLITFVTLVVTRATLNYYVSFFSHHMESYNIDQNQAALIISLPQIACIIAMPTIIWIAKGDTHFEFIQSLSVVCSFIGIAIISPIWSNGKDIHHVWIGLLVMGLGSALNRIPAIPVLTLSLKKMNLPGTEKQGLSDMASALFQMNISMSNLIFPVIGGGLYDLYGGQTKNFSQERSAFRFAMLSLLIVQVIQFCFDLIMNGGLQIWQQTFTGKNERQDKLVGNGKRNESNTEIKSLILDSDNYSEDSSTPNSQANTSINDYTK